ncbi:uncharacterized protein LOC111897099 [Lactuca sativa]|uniref:uncharacterized protein LOC111897099 n=1 Tax=Lactuca sativa TaxID=4236 RepID=UPI000CD9BBBD|nr:uncharacterized protein LOC111897099 [Lactuca sativa]
MEQEFDEHDSDSSSEEIRHTVEVSKELGFDIEVDNPILKEVMGGEDVAGCWDSLEFSWSAVEATGRSGGILSIWDNNVFNVMEVIRSRYYLITVGRWIGIQGLTILANIYVPQAPVGKLKLWNDLINIKNEKHGTWIIFGDFNVARRPKERINSQFCSSSSSAFNRFIAEAGLHDLRMGGHRFTLFCGDDLKLSKLDRYLVCSNFMNQFPIASVTALPRDLSDHCLVLLSTAVSDFGPPPFRFFSSWMLREGFDGVVTSAWINFVGYGTPDMILVVKLRYLKKEIKKMACNQPPTRNG